MLLSRLADQRRMPWKNGGGETTELFVLPRGATLDTFALRLSRASVASDGPFSRFDGVDRSLVVVRGAGLSLRIEGHGAPVRLDGGARPYVFPGELAIDATRIDGPIEDLNVMTRRTTYEHALAWAAIDGEVRLARRGVILGLVVVDGAIDVAGARLEAGEALLHDDDTPLVVRAASARVLRVDVTAAR